MNCINLFMPIKYNFKTHNVKLCISSTVSLLTKPVRADSPGVDKGVNVIRDGWTNSESRTNIKGDNKKKKPIIIIY